MRKLPVNLNPNTNLDSVVKEVPETGAKDINAGKDHRQAGGESLHNVVRVIHDGGNDDTRESLHLRTRSHHHIQKNRNPGVRVVAGEESLLANSRQILGSRIQTAEEAGGETELNALNPNVTLRFSLQNHFKEDSGESTCQGANDNADEPKKGILRRRIHLHGGTLATQLDETDARNDDNQCNPLAERQVLVEEEHGEQGGRQDLHLIRDGIDGRVQIRDCNETNDQNGTSPPNRRLF